jgi:hypothetical protein
VIEILLCGYNLFCSVEKLMQDKPSVIKYYEAGKSCYVNGTFYLKCEESNADKPS